MYYQLARAQNIKIRRKRRRGSEQRTLTNANELTDANELTNANELTSNRGLIMFRIVEAEHIKSVKEIDNYKNLIVTLRLFSRS
jgi:hypothetical protein